MDDDELRKLNELRKYLEEEIRKSMYGESECIRDWDLHKRDGGRQEAYRAVLGKLREYFPQLPEPEEPLRSRHDLERERQRRCGH